MLPTRQEPERIVKAAIAPYPFVDGCRRVKVVTEAGKTYSGIISLDGEAGDYPKYEPDGDVDDLRDNGDLELK